MFRFLMVISISLVALLSHAQYTKQDEINETLAEIANADSDTTKSRHHVTLAIIYRSFDIEKSDSVSKIAFDLALRSGDNFYLAKAVDNLGYTDVSRGFFDLGIVKFKKALNLLSADTVNISKNDFKTNSQLARIYNNLGMAYDYKSQYSTSIKYYLKSRDIFKKIGKSDGVGVAENNLGISYLYLMDFDQAREHFQEAYDIYIEEVRDTNTAYQAITNIGVISYLTGDTITALNLFRESADIMLKIGNLRSYARSVTNIAEIYQEQGRNDSAIYYLNSAIEVDSDLNDIEGLETDYRIMGSLLQDQKKYSQAREYFLKALDLNLQVNRKISIMDSYTSLYELEKEVKNFQKAIEYLELRVVYKDSIQLESNSKKIGKIEAQHEFNKELAVNEAEHAQQLKIEEERRRRSELVLYFTIGIIVVIMFFIYVLIKSLKQTRKQKELVEEARLEISQKNEEMVASITYAKRIQTAILPPDSKVEQLLKNAFVIYKPKDIVAGDFYWLESKEGTTLFAAADCTGHGVPGAMVSVVCNNGLNRSVREYGLTDPAEILNKTRDIVVTEFEKSVDEVKDGMDIALCALQGNNLKYAGAHNPLWIIRKGTDEIEEIKADKQPIGKFDLTKPFTTHSTQLNPGDTIYIFSDGYVDQFGGEKGKKFKAANFKTLLLSIVNLPMAEQKIRLDEAFEEWRGNIEQLDDVCVIGVRV